MFGLKNYTWDIEMLCIFEGLIDPSLYDLGVQTQGAIPSLMKFLEPSLEAHVY